MMFALISVCVSVSGFQKKKTVIKKKKKKKTQKVWHVCGLERDREGRKGCSLLETQLVEYVSLRKLYRPAKLKAFMAHMHTHFR